MVKSATELKAGDVIRFEYGDYDNWAECTVKEAVTVGNTVNVKGVYQFPDGCLPAQRNYPNGERPEAYGRYRCIFNPVHPV